MNYTKHETAVVDAGCTIGDGTKIWHFSHIMPDAILGEKCNIGQNVVISPKVTLGKNVKVQNNDNGFFPFKALNSRHKLFLCIFVQSTGSLVKH